MPALQNYIRFLVAAKTRSWGCRTASKYIPHSRIPFSSEMSGFYTEHAPTNQSVISIATPLMVDAVTSVPVTPGSVFTIADYGTADGGVSMPLMYACVKELRRKHGNDLPVHVIYEDQPFNDFKSLFMRLQGLIPGPPSYFQDFPNVFATACGTNFYSQCLPKNSVTVGYSSIAAHWLRELPCHNTGCLVSALITVPEEREKFRQQAENDWEKYLLTRAAELVPGGRLINVDLITNDQGEFLGSRGKVSLFECMNWILEGMVKDGIITKEEYQQTTIAHYYRTLKEIKKPFESQDSPVKKAGLELVATNAVTINCAHHDTWMKEKGDSKAYAQEYTLGALRRWSSSSLKSGLSTTRTMGEKTQIVDEYFNRYADEVAKHPEDHACEYPLAFVVMQKRK